MWKKIGMRLRVVLGVSLSSLSIDAAMLEGNTESLKKDISQAQKDGKLSSQQELLERIKEAFQHHEMDMKLQLLNSILKPDAYRTQILQLLQIQKEEGKQKRVSKWLNALAKGNLPKKWLVDFFEHQHEWLQNSSLSLSSASRKSDGSPPKVTAGETNLEKKNAATQLIKKFLTNSIPFLGNLNRNLR